MRTKKHLNLRQQFGLLIITFLFGGLALAGVLVSKYHEVQLSGRELNSHAKTQLEVSYFRERAAAWLLSLDTIALERDQTFGVLEEAAITQGEMLGQQLQAMGRSQLLSQESGKLVAIQSAITELRGQLVAMQANATESSRIKRRSVRDEVQKLADPLPRMLRELDERSITLRSSAILSHQIEREQLRLWTFAGSVAYLLLAFGVWRYGALKLAKPLHQLAADVDHSYEFGAKVHTEHGGPAEVRELAKTFRAMASDLENANESMRVLEAETDALLESIPAILIGLDPGGYIVLWNAAATRNFGLIQKQAINRHITDVPIPWTDANTPESLVETLGWDGVQVMPEVPFTDTHGVRKVLSVTTTPVSYRSRGTGTLVLGTDITDQRSLEAQVRHSQKLESVGQLAGGIAHEINTPIQYVGHSIHFLQEAFDDMGSILASYKTLKDCVKDIECAEFALQLIEEAEEEADIELLEEEVPGAIERAIEGVDRVANIVGAMKRFAHPGATSFAPANLNEAVQTTLTVANNEVRYVANINEQLGSIPPVECDLGDINQVLLNLIVNAAHAIAEKEGEKGTITIRTSRRGAFVVVEITDTGKGIPPEIAESIFDPFFTTKEVGKGTGQGLAIAHTIICEKHHGALTFQSQLGQGTTFRIELPVRQAVAA